MKLALCESTMLESPGIRLERSAARAISWLQDLVFPPSCGNCGRVDFRFCAGCRRELDLLPLEDYSDKLEELEAVFATGKHHHILQNAVQAFKYEGARELAEPLAGRLADAMRQSKCRIDVIAPVPLFADREAERGYNQAALLGQHLSVAMGAAYGADSLKRVRETSQQALLSPAERKRNVRGAFVARADVKGLSVLLVDDVVTTGSTLRECAIALKEKEAFAVYGIAVSHA